MRKKKYISQRTRATHTYSFYRQRRNDPNWRADYLAARVCRQRHILISLIIILVLILIGVIGYRNRVVTLLNGSETTSQVTTVKNASGEDSIKDSTKQSVSNEQTKTIDNVQKTVTISDYQRYSAYSGEYGSETQTCSLDFATGELMTTGPQKQQVFYFDKVMLHPDKSLVINMHGNYHYNAYDGKGERDRLVHLSVLFAPRDQKITQNWQTGKSLEDGTNTAVNRFSIALSNDGGKVFQMSPAYTAFETNQTKGDTLAVIYSEAN